MTWDSIGYHAVGSGSPHAVTTLIANDYHQGIPLNKALLITYEAKKIAERAPGVGSNTNVAIINNDGVVMFDSSKIQTLDEVYRKKTEAELVWKQEKDWENGLEELTRKNEAE
jgi:20S proteasome alpha/beta subunit